MVWDYGAVSRLRSAGPARPRGRGTRGAGGERQRKDASRGARWRFRRAASLVAEADSVIDATGARVAPYGALVLAGFQGRVAEASELIDATIEECTAGGQGTAVQYARWARAVLHNGLGRYQEAVDAAQEASDDTPELFVSVWAAIELLEAATRSDMPELAHTAHERIAAATRRCAHRLGPRHPCPFRCAAERRRDRRAPVSRGNRTAGPHTTTP